MKRDIIEDYFNHLEESFKCEVRENKYLKTYIFSDESGIGHLSRVTLDHGLDICKFNIENNLHLVYDNSRECPEMLEVGYCYKGRMDVVMYPSKNRVSIKAGDTFIYKMKNTVERFEFFYRDAETISISMSSDLLMNYVCGYDRHSVERDWHHQINCIFNQQVLIVEKAHNQIEHEMHAFRSLLVEDIMGYIGLKSKALEVISKMTLYMNSKRKVCACRCDGINTIERAIKVVDNNYMEIDSIDVLSKLTGLSAYKLQKGFKIKTGMTVYAYIRMRRLGHGAKLLIESELSILEIANEIGFDNPSKFASAFKVYKGLSPLQYRKNEYSNQLKTP